MLIMFFSLCANCLPCEEQKLPEQRNLNWEKHQPADLSDVPRDEKCKCRRPKKGFANSFS